MRAQRKAEEDKAEEDKAGAVSRARRGRKWAVGIGAAMWACGFFVARVPDATRPEFSGASALFVVAFALPSYIVLWKWAGPARGLQVLAALGAFAMGIESLAVATGWPYGQFSYGDAIGGKVAGLVPWTVPFAWTPLVLGTHALAERLQHRLPGLGNLGNLGLSGLRAQVLGVALGTALLLVSDLVLDPGAVRQKFWSYQAGGLYYGVPASNYFGWLLSGLAGHTLLRFLLRPAISKHAPSRVGRESNRANRERWPRVPWRLGERPGLLGPAPAGLAVSLGWTLAFWSSVCAWAGLWAPAAIGHAALAGLWLALRCGWSCAAAHWPRAHPNNQ